MKNLVFLLIPVMGMVILSSCKKRRGCTNPAAINYSPDSRVEDGSCSSKGEWRLDKIVLFSYPDTNYNGVPWDPADGPDVQLRVNIGGSSCPQIFPQIYNDATGEPLEFVDDTCDRTGVCGDYFNITFSELDGTLITSMGGTSFDPCQNAWRLDEDGKMVFQNSNGIVFHVYMTLFPEEPPVY